MKYKINFQILVFVLIMLLLIIILILKMINIFIACLTTEVYIMYYSELHIAVVLIIVSTGGSG